MTTTHDLDGSLLLIPDEIRQRPALIIHGGGWRWGQPDHMLCFARPLLATGHPCLLLRYRLIETDPWPAMGEDCVRGVQDLCGGCDGRLAASDQVLVIGASAGGHLALWAACACPDQIAGVVSASGCFDVKRARDRKVSEGFFDEAHYRRLFGHEPTDDDWRSITPAPTPGAPPLLCLHATEDRLVFFEQSQAALAAWQAMGSPTACCTLPGGGVKNHALHDDDLCNDDPLAGNDLARRTLRPAFAKALTDWCNGR